VRALRRWKTGLAVALIGFAVGSVRLVATGDTDWLTWVWFVIAAVYVFAGLVGRRLVFPERAEDLLGPLERRPRFAALLGESPDQPDSDGNLVQRVKYMQHGSEEMMTRNRIANALATIAAIVGMVLVFTGAGTQGGGDDDAPSSPAPPGRSAPVVPGQNQPDAPAQSNAPAPVQTQAPVAPPEKDNDGDDDGN
jgi:hypothetical protein